MGGQRGTLRARVMLAACLMLLLGACSNDSNNNRNRPPDDFTVTGSIGDGPIIDALVTVVDGDGERVAVTRSDNQANYEVRIPHDAKLPVAVHVLGGLDLVTQRGADFGMVALLRETGEQTVNVSPLTTLAVRAAECGNSLSQSTFDQLWQTLGAQLNIGLDLDVLADPMTDQITTANVETAVLANEAIGELIRRTGQGLSGSGISLDEVVDVLACDLADGALDGVSVAPVTGDDARVFAVAKAAEIGIRLEVLAGALHVDARDASGAMNDAVATIMPALDAPNVNAVPVIADHIRMVLDGLAVLESVLGDPELNLLRIALADAEIGDVRVLVNAALDAEASNTLAGLPERIALSSEALVTDLTSGIAAQTDIAAPFVALSADAEHINDGDRARLSWWTKNADSCAAAGAWQGNRDTDGGFTSEPLRDDSRFELTCTGLGGVTTAYVSIRVRGSDGSAAVGDSADEPADATTDQGASENDSTGGTAPSDGTGSPVSTTSPAVRLTSSAPLVNAGGEVTLSWTSQHASSCSASGAWQGTKASSGSQVVGPINGAQTFSITCSGSGGSAVAMVSVNTMGRLRLAWQAPTENVDGTPIEGLSSYRIHVGNYSGDYDEVVTVSGDATAHTLNLPSGMYYVVVTAVDLDGHESVFSNEVHRGSS